ncbi:hypothetical protein [Cellulomonas endophytica]|uniref:hypothetical protein n=1 Tax=Cellulomonas endophytica TaxID=2494735 RepID=UPI001012B5B5|nr:hypothetical protein [Cellulomonas endophytica]
MSVSAIDPCVGPIGLACDALTGVQGAASDYVLSGLGSAFLTGAAQLGQLALAALDATTTVDLSVGWFRANVSVLTAVALPVLVGLFVVQVFTSVLRREPGGLARALVGVAKATLGCALAQAVTQLALVAVDGICEFIAARAGMTVAAAAAQFFAFGALTSVSPALQLLLGFVLQVGFLLLWGVLLFRKAALLVVAVFAPIAFAGSAWDATRAWTRRWIEVVAALVFCKLVVVVVFVVGASAFTRVSPATTDTGPAAPGSADTAVGALSDVLVGVLLLAIAVWAPWLTFKFVHWSGVEAAAIMTGAVAANPINRTARSAATTVRYAAQQAVMSQVLAGAGSKLKPPPAGATAPPRPAVAVSTPPARPARPGGSS